MVLSCSAFQVQILKCLAERQDWPFTARELKGFVTFASPMLHACDCLGVCVMLVSARDAGRCMRWAINALSRG